MFSLFRTLRFSLAVLIAVSTTFAQSDTTISGRVIATITNGDFVHPAFSPDGRFLAYSRVLVSRDFENTEVVIHDLRTNRKTVLLNSKQAKKYATYKASVTGMKWTSARRLEVEVSDGDMGLTYLSFDPLSRKLLRERTEDLDLLELETPRLSSGYETAYQQARLLFPSTSEEVLIRAFNDGVAFKSKIVLALQRGPKTYLYLYQDGKIDELGQFNSSGPGAIEVKHTSPARVIFLLKTHAPYERGDNPLFVFDGRQLVRIKEYSELYDANIDSRGRRIVFSYWAGEKRHIAVKELR